jgi:DNA-binding NarL/FixJ family response regulator
MTALAHQNTGWQGKLTPRQAEVLELLAAGYTNHEIAQEHYVTEHSVKSLITEIYLRLGLHIEGGREHVRAGSSRVKAARWWWTHVENCRSVREIRES